MKKGKKVILIIILYVALFFIGLEIYELDRYGIDSNKSIPSQLAGLIANSLLALGCFWELYFEKKK